MNTIGVVTLVLIGVWAVSVVIAGVYAWFKIMPVVRILRETPEGRKEITKAVFPPRFRS